MLPDLMASELLPQLRPFWQGKDCLVGADQPESLPPVLTLCEKIFKP